MTIQRAENTDSEEGLKNIFKAIEEISEDIQVILPLHPRTKKYLDMYGLKTKNITLISPLDSLGMIWLIDHCQLVITDSGGLQKEASLFKKHCITLRDETEWTELIENDFNVLVGADKKNIIEKYKTFNFSRDFSKNLYGNGNASKNIVQSLLD